MKRWRFTQSERHLRTVIIEGPDDMTTEQATDMIMLGHDYEGTKVLDDVTEYQDVIQDATCEEVKGSTVKGWFAAGKDR